MNPFHSFVAGKMLYCVLCVACSFVLLQERTYASLYTRSHLVIPSLLLFCVFIDVSFSCTTGIETISETACKGSSGPEWSTVCVCVSAKKWKTVHWKEEEFSKELLKLVGLCNFSTTRFVDWLNINIDCCTVWIFSYWVEFRFSERFE